MTHRKYIALSVTVFLSSICLSSYAMAESNGDESISGKRPLLTPMAHTNQDDEARSMYLPDPDDKEPGGSSIDFTMDVRPAGLIEIAIITSTPEFIGDWIESDVNIADLDLDAYSEFNPGFVSDIRISESVDLMMTDSQPGISGLNVPAPGVLTLLALAGLSRRRRRG